MTVLFDSRCAATLVNHRLVKDLKQTRENKTKWRTKAGKFTKLDTTYVDEFEQEIMLVHDPVTKQNGFRE